MALTLSSRPKETEAFLNNYFKVQPGLLTVFGREEWFAPVASGSNPADAMAVCPCTMGTLSAIAAGLGQKLIERAADVMLKEQRKLILVVRETPFSAIHLESMLRLAHSGAIILPANPGFYHQPENIQDIIDFIVARILDQLDVTHTLMPRWGNDR
jgi:4-hydroxy-3-polyprenylbenzoate decarboxylase